VQWLSLVGTLLILAGLIPFLVRSFHKEGVTMRVRLWGFLMVVLGGLVNLAALLTMLAQ